MLDLDPNALLAAATGLARLHQLFSALPAAHAEIVLPATAGRMLPALQSFREQCATTGARFAVMHIDRLITQLSAEPCVITIAETLSRFHEIESRFADHLTFTKLFIVHENDAVLLRGANDLLNEQTALMFPDVWFDCEEAAKCICFGRATAAVFHSMRILERALRMVARRLGIADPTRGADRSWHFLLSKLKQAIDDKWPIATRMTNAEGQSFEALYASFDAIKNPWRNATMHVEGVYTLEEARNIAATSLMLLERAAQLFTEYPSEDHDDQKVLGDEPVDFS